MHYNVLNVINVRLGPSLRSRGQLCFPKRKSLSVACVIGYSVCFIVACLGQCYQCEQLGKVCQEDPVAVGIMEERKKKKAPSPILFLDRVNEFSPPV